MSQELTYELLKANNNWTIGTKNSVLNIISQDSSITNLFLNNGILQNNKSIEQILLEDNSNNKLLNLEQINKLIKNNNITDNSNILVLQNLLNELTENYYIIDSYFNKLNENYDILENSLNIIIINKLVLESSLNNFTYSPCFKNLKISDDILFNDNLNNILLAKIKGILQGTNYGEIQFFIKNSDDSLTKKMSITNTGAILSQDLSVCGTTLSSTLVISGATTLQNLSAGTTDISSTLNVAGLITANDGLIVENGKRLTSNLVDIKGGAIDGTNITVGSEKTLNVSGGTLILADNQISGDKINGGTIDNITISQLSGAMNCNNNYIRNVNIDSGAVDGTIIGANTPAAATFSQINLYHSSGESTIINGVNKITIDPFPTAGDICGTVVIKGDLIVDGITTTINSTIVDISDNILTLNSNLASNIAASLNAGFVVNRGSIENVSFLWDETNTRWTIGNQTFNSEALIAKSLNVTDLKANDGTLAGSIADSTGVVTLNSNLNVNQDVTISGDLLLIERLKIMGAIGTSGDNYGTVGQVLTSNGNSDPPSWSSRQYICVNLNGHITGNDSGNPARLNNFNILSTNSILGWSNHGTFTVPSSGDYKINIVMCILAQTQTSPHVVCGALVTRQAVNSSEIIINKSSQSMEEVPLPNTGALFKRIQVCANFIYILNESDIIRFYLDVPNRHYVAIGDNQYMPTGLLLSNYNNSYSSGSNYRETYITIEKM